ncbi:hypothetical protein MLD38_013341 [Melastoma candidum]|uniref:Uncharacterized protein n=1 Tax=Melastoma candidum TaxID=119954 RepID=A0ACB9R980_9MYRT|nr:hypothetical protein MLD38_013341 [Melastoma candidum]
MGNDRNPRHTSGRRRSPSLSPTSPCPDKKRRLEPPPLASQPHVPNLPTKRRVLFEIVANTPPSSLERDLEESGIRVTREDVEEVLKLSYAFPSSAVKFFRWSGRLLNDDHSPYAWNLVVDMLGKNSLFDAMWEAIKSMMRKGLISLATFASVFSNYVVADRVKDALLTYEVMDQYGVPRDVVALNSLVSAICRDGRTKAAAAFLLVEKERVRPDTDTYAILLEGSENEGDVPGSKQTFSNMVYEIGWDTKNVPAYTSFLCTLLRGSGGLHEAMKFYEMVSERRCYPGMKFFKDALDNCVKRVDTEGAVLIWEAMTRRVGFRPDTEMCNSMIALHCFDNRIDSAKRLFDEMVYLGTFPDDRTYNLLFQFLVKSRRLGEALSLFDEMIKNEILPSRANCIAAVKLYVDSSEPGAAIRVWKWMIQHYFSELDDTGNFLIVGLLDLERLPEAVKYSKDIIERGIKLYSSTLSRLKQSLFKVRKEPVYEELSRKWKAHRQL